VGYEYEAALGGDSGFLMSGLLRAVTVGLSIGTTPSNPESSRLKFSCNGGDICDGGGCGGGVYVWLA
jgi:hypothetical protein